MKTAVEAKEYKKITDFQKKLKELLKPVNELITSNEEYGCFYAFSHGKRPIVQGVMGDRSNLTLLMNNCMINEPDFSMLTLSAINVEFEAAHHRRNRNEIIDSIMQEVGDSIFDNKDINPNPDKVKD